MITAHALAVLMAVMAVGASILTAAEPETRLVGKENATPEAPSNPQTLAGDYYRGSGLAYNLHLTLKANGEYAAKWDSCLYKPGEASGKWTLAERKITFTPPMEGEMLRGRIDGAEILKFHGEWILLPNDDQARKIYDKEGVTAFSCFQRTDLAGTWQFDNGVMGEFYTLKLEELRSFSLVSRDEPLQAEDTYLGTWQVRDGKLHLRFIRGYAKSGEALTPKPHTRIFSIAPDQQSLSAVDVDKFQFKKMKQHSKGGP